MKLSDLVKTKEIAIPGTDIKITLRDDLSWYDYLESLKIQNIDDRGAFMVAKLISSWNITGDDGKVLPVTDELVKKLPKKVAIVLVDKVNEMLFDKSEKKKISPKKRSSS